MKLVSWNVNGIRSVHRKGFLKWFEDQKVDIVCLQEVKATRDDVADDLDYQALLNPKKYHSFWNPAKKPGYSGTTIYTKDEPLSVENGIGISKFDDEGRIIVAEYKDFILINAYFPNSQRDHARLPYKLEFCAAMLKFMEGLRKKGKNIVLCGDYNIAHTEIDLRNPKSNQKNAGFLPQEREWMSSYLKKGYIDVFRHFTKDPGHYTWWSNRPGVRERNIGWRIDYFTVNPEFTDRLKRMEHQTQVYGSDHCPILLALKD